MPELRTENIIFRASPTEVAMLRAIAESTGLTSADVLRSCIRREYAKIRRAEPVPPPAVKRGAKKTRALK